MTRTRGIPTLLGLLVTCAAIPACDGKVLSFSAAQSSELASIDGGTKIADLTVDQANALCSWVIASFPYQVEPGSQLDRPELATGYVSGPNAGCPLAGSFTPKPHQLSFIHLPQDQCVLNLRLGTCQATLASLEQCVTSFQETFPSTCNAGDDAGVDCAAFEAAPGCTATVIQATTILSCMNALPIEPDASCPPAGLTDASTD
jgi:hypothetical protein